MPSRNPTTVVRDEDRRGRPAAGTSLVSLGVWLCLIHRSDFEEHDATSALASVVLIGVWLCLPNALILPANRAPEYRHERSNGHRGGAMADRG